MNPIFIILLVTLYLKWILFVILYPFQVLWSLYSKHRTIAFKIVAVPGYAIKRITRGGDERFVIYHISTIPSRKLRQLLYKGLGVSIARNAVLHFKTEIRSPWLLKIGKGAIIGDNAILDARCGLCIGENVNISSNVSIYTLQHDYKDPFFRCPEPTKQKMSVEIDARAWLGSNVTVLPGVHIGEGSVCCAGSVITKDVEPFAVVAGIPAKKINERPRELEYEFDGKSSPWFY